MRTVPLATALALLSACATRPAQPQDPAPVAALEPDAPRPGWVEHAPFAISSSTAHALYATAHAPLPDGNDCADPARVMEQAASRARAALVRALSGTDGDMAMGTLRGVESAAAWFDGSARQAHVLVRVDIDAVPRQLEAGTAQLLGGERPSGVTARIITAERARLDASGVCRDPHRRADYPCCGPVNQMCHDPARFDAQTPPSCRCGDSGAPCLQDFACERGRCVCRGPACPCDILRCREGQTCGDGRCY